MNARLRQLKAPTVICFGYVLYTKVREVALPSRGYGILNYTSGRCKYMDRHKLMKALHGKIIKTLIFLVTYFVIISDLCFFRKQQMDEIALLYDMPLNMKVTAMSSLCIVKTSGALHSSFATVQGVSRRPITTGL